MERVAGAWYLESPLARAGGRASGSALTSGSLVKLGISRPRDQLASSTQRQQCQAGRPSDRRFHTPYHAPWNDSPALANPP